MAIQPGTHRFGPENATLTVKTGRRGAAAKAGHDLVIEVTSWQASLELGEEPEQLGLALDADARSLRVREGIGGVQPLSDDDKEEIRRTIDGEVLEGQRIEFRSTDAEVSEDRRRLRISGTLEMAGQSNRVDCELNVTGDGRITGGTTLKQTDWGIKPYSGLFGALKVADEVEVEVEVGLPSG